MLNGFDVRIVPNEEFEQIIAADPRYVNASDSWSIADPQNGKAYIRQTQIPEVNKYLVEHEIHHLLNPEDVAHMDEHGIYHKGGFGRALQIAAAPATLGLSLPEVRGAISPKVQPFLPSGLREFVPNRQGQTGGIKEFGINAALAVPSLLTAGGAGAATTGLQAGRGALSASGGGSQVAGKIGKVGLKGFLGPGGGGGFTSPGVTSQVLNRAGSTALSVPKLAGSLSGSGVANVANPLLSGGAAATAASTLAPTAGSATAPGGNQFLSGVKDFLGFGQGQGGTGAGGINWGKELLGAGIGALGNKLAPTPDVPNFGDLESVQGLKRFGQGPQSEVARLAQSRLAEQLQAGQPGFDPDIESGIKRAFDRRRAEVSSQFKQFRPGADLATDTAFRQAMTDVDAEEATTIAEAKQRAQSEFAGQRQQQIQQALGIDEQSFNQMSQIAQLDIDQIMAQYGVDATTARDFKSIFANVGQGLMESGLGLQRFVPQTATV